MDDAPEPDQYEECLREVFHGFDASTAGSLSSEEVAALCYSLQLGEATPTLLHALLQHQEDAGPAGRVTFERFKDALILVLSSSMEASSAQSPQEPPEAPPPAESPEIQPKFVKGSKRYGRRSTPEFLEPLLDSSDAGDGQGHEGGTARGDKDSGVSRKRERCNPVHETSTEEFEAEGQLTLWNPDEPGNPRGSRSDGSLSERLEVRLQEACEDLSMPCDGSARLEDLLGLAAHLGMEVTGEVNQRVREEGGELDVREFVRRVVGHCQPATPSSSTPYRQLKRLHSTQSFDEAGRRIATPSMMTSSITLHLFTALDDGTGHAPVENLLDAWLDEGIANTSEILKALDLGLGLDGRVNLAELTSALENELLVTRNGLHQAALASFKAEIRHLLDRLDLELQEKERVLLDLERLERLKSQLAAEVDENHSVIERTHHLKLRKLEQEHKERVGAVRSELLTEMEQLQQQAALRREQLEAELEKTRADESFMRDHLSISIQENRRLEMELLDGNEKLAAAQVQNSKLQASLEKILQEKFGDLDPGREELFCQEERIKLLCSGYEAQCRELQDRIDELQSERTLRALGRRSQPGKPLGDELESKSPGMESDPGLGTEETQPFNMSLEAEMMLEQLKEQHGRRLEHLQAQLESKSQEFDQCIEEQRSAHEAQNASISYQHQEEVQAFREQLSGLQSQAQDLQTQLEHARLERLGLERRQAEEREELELQQEEEVASLRRRLLESHTQVSNLEEQLATASEEAQRVAEVEELKMRHMLELKHLQEKQELLLEEERMQMQEMTALLLERACKEKERLVLSHGVELSSRLEEAQQRFEEEKEVLLERLTEEWRRERAVLEEQSNQNLQEVLEAGMLRLVKEQEEKESKLREQLEEQRDGLQKAQEEALLVVLEKERLKLREQQEQREKRLKEAWEEEKIQLEEDYEGMHQDRLKDEREKMEEEKENEEKRLERLLQEKTSCLEERHREEVKRLTARHREEREELQGALDRLREEIIQEREAIEVHFSQRIREVEERLSDDHDSAAARFQADVMKLELHYQAELLALSQSHAELALALRGETDVALLEAEDQRRQTLEAMEQESARREEVSVLLRERQELERELERLAASSQAQERDLGRQLDELHGRLRESQASGDDLLAASEEKALELEVLLSQAAEDFMQERAELQSSLPQLEEKYKEAVALSEEQSQERLEQLEGLKNQVEGLETTLQQVVADFEFERLELQQSISVLEDELKKNLCCLESLENQRVEFTSERDQLNLRITEMENERIMRGDIPNGNLLVDESVYVDALNMSVEGQEPQSRGNIEEKPVHDDAVIIIQSESSALDMVPEAPVDEEQNMDVSVEAPVGCGFPTGTPVKEWSCSSTAIGAPRETSTTLLEQYHGNQRPEDSLVAVEDHKANGVDLRGRRSDVPEEPQEAEPFEEEEQPFEEEEQPFALELKGHRFTVAVESWDPEESPQGSAVEAEYETTHHPEQRPCHSPVVDLVTPERAGDSSYEPTPQELAVCCLSVDSQQCGKQIKLVSKECKALQVLYGSTIAENTLLHHKISLLQQKTGALERILAYNHQTIKMGSRALQDNFNLELRLLSSTNRTKELEAKVSEMAAICAQYETGRLENVKLREQNGKLTQWVSSLESRLGVVCEFQGQHTGLVEEISRMERDNATLSELVRGLELQGDPSLPEETGTWETGSNERPFLQETGVQLEARPQTAIHLEVYCGDLEVQNAELRWALDDLEGKAQTLSEWMQVDRSETSRLEEENVYLSQKISDLKAEDLNGTNAELLQKLDNLQKERTEAENMTENFQNQISDLRARGHHLQEENVMLSQKNTQSSADLEEIGQQLAELIQENRRREAEPAKDKLQMDTCMARLEAKVTTSLEEAGRLEERNVGLKKQLFALREKVTRVDTVEDQLSQLMKERRTLDKDVQALRSQLARAQDKVKTLDGAVQTSALQASQLKTDLRVTRQEKEALHHEALALHKQLRNAHNKVQILELAFRSGGFQEHKKLYRQELSLLNDQEEKLLKQENQRLHADLLQSRGDLEHCREKVHQLETATVSLKQQNHAGQVTVLEQENTSLKKQLEVQNGLNKSTGGKGDSHRELESLRQENEVLKAQTARLSTQLIEAFQAQLVGLLPGSPHRAQRAQHRGEEPDNMQDERERKMKKMEERMMEIELTLHNVKLLLRDKVAQLKDQLRKSGKADVMIQDLYVENSHLLKALQQTEQQQQMVEKKNYLLEQKISSLSKIMRNLSPSPLSPTSYRSKCS